MAHVIRGMDDKVDDLRRAMFRIVATHILEDSKCIEGGLELLLVAQNRERIADLATNVAEDVVFMMEGRNIKHTRSLHENNASL
jgi:phosphate transport system protein